MGRQSNRAGKPTAEVRKAVAERRIEIQSLMLAGYTLSQLHRYAEDRGWSYAQVENDYRFISDEWTKQSEEELQHARAQAIQRIRKDLTEMREPPPVKGKGKKGSPTRAQASYKDIAAHEMLLARIEGTLRPVEVKVDVRASSRRALIDTINGMSPDEMDRIVAEQRAFELRLQGK
jgi:hypothetical protein